MSPKLATNSVADAARRRAIQAAVGRADAVCASTPPTASAPPAAAPFSSTSRRVTGRSHTAPSTLSLISSSFRGRAPRDRPRMGRPYSTGAPHNSHPLSKQPRREHPQHVRRLPPVVPDEVRYRRRIVDAVAGLEPMLDAVDAERERPGEDVRELLARVRVVVAWIAGLAGCDRYE